MIEQLIEAWNISSKMNLLILSSLKEEDLKLKADDASRNVGMQFAHIHNVRLLWLNIADPCFLVGLSRIEKNSSISLDFLLNNLTASGKSIENLIKKKFEKGEIPGFKSSIYTFQSYMIAHESHHRGQIILTLKLCGKTLDKNVTYGIWEWDGF